MAWHEIVPGLWQGSGRTTPEGFDVVLTCSRTAANRYPPNGGEHWRFVFRDGRRVPASNSILTWARRLSDELDQGRCALVRCKGGLNRSGLLVAATLVHRGMTPDEAIALIRRRHSPRALTNRRFVAQLRELPDVK